MKFFKIKKKNKRQNIANQKVSSDNCFTLVEVSAVVEEEVALT